MEMEVGRDWEKFIGGPFVPFAERLYVTLSGRGKLLLNRKAYESLGSPKRILLYFNRQKASIGIRPAHDHLAEAFPVRVTGGSFVFYVGTFCRHFRINLLGTDKFVSPEIAADGTLVLDLTKTIAVGGRTRKPYIKKNS